MNNDQESSQYILKFAKRDVSKRMKKEFKVRSSVEPNLFDITDMKYSH